MLKYLVLGSGLAFAAAIQPGPLQAFLLTRTAASGWRRTLPACLSPLISDGPIALVALLVLGQLPPIFQSVVRAAGGAFLIYLAWTALRQWRTGAGTGSIVSAPRTLLEATLVNLLNPNPYIAWALVIGPAVLAAWHEHPSHAMTLVAAFYGTMTVVLAGFIFLAGTSGLLGARGRRALIGVSALVLAALGVYLLASTMWRAGSP
jgi:threonine/homoserine/homoserine lactone efflux protein